MGIAFFTVTSLGNFTLGIWLASGEISPARLLRTPLIWAALAGVAFLAVETEPPLWLFQYDTVDRGLHDSGDPDRCWGVALARLRVADMGRAELIGVFRLGLGFPLGLLLAELLGFEGVARGVLVLQCAMPGGRLQLLFAQRYGNCPSDVAGGVVVSTGDIVSDAAVPDRLPSFEARGSAGGRTGGGGGGFEPTVRRAYNGFETAPFGHSGTPPRERPPQ